MDLEKIRNYLLELEQWWARLGFRISFYYDKDEMGEFIYFVKVPLSFNRHLTSNEEKEIRKHYNMVALYQFDSEESAISFITGIKLGFDLQLDYRYNFGEKIEKAFLSM